jgi:DNA-binding CsgD family transcriptional regulator
MFPITSSDHMERRTIILNNAAKSREENRDRTVPFASATSALEWLRSHGLETCYQDDRSLIEWALEIIPATERNADPVCIAVRAALARYEGHVDQALSLFERAIRKAKNDDDLYLQIAEHLLLLQMARRDHSSVDNLLDAALRKRPDDPRILSCRAYQRAVRNDRRALADIEALTPPNHPSELVQSRIYLRLSSASHTMGRIDLSEQYALIAAELAESCDSNRIASCAYQNLCSIYSNDVADIGLSLHYSDLTANAALNAHDQTQWFLSLVTRYSIAAEIGNRALLMDIRDQLAPLRGAEKYTERFAIVLPDAISHAWDGNFDLMRQYLKAIGVDRAGDSQHAMLEAVQAIACCGTREQDDALQHAYRAITLGRPRKGCSSFDNRLRLIARTLASSVLIRYDRRSEAVRMLDTFGAHTTLSIRRFMEATAADSFDALRDTAPDLYGYGIALQALKTAIGNRNDNIILTDREREILQACATGETSRSIAKMLSIDESTVVWHRNNILKKLSVHRMLAAVDKARSLRLIR